MSGDRIRPGKDAPLETSLRLVCSEWSFLQQLYENHISKKRLIVRRNTPVEMGSHLDVLLELPDGSVLRLSGTVLRVADPTPGDTMFRIGLQLDPSSDFDAIARRVSEIKGRSVGTADQPVKHPAGRSPAPSGDGITERPTPVQVRSSQPGIPQAQSPRASQPGVPQPRPKPASHTGPGERARTHASAVRRSQLDFPRPGESSAVIKRDRATGPVVGIDFGTSYCSVGIIGDTGLQLFSDHTGATAFPSVVWFRGRGDYVVGHSAREKLVTEPNKTIPSIKRLLGRKIDEPQAAPFLMSLACSGSAGPNRSIVFDINGEQFTPLLVAAIIMRYLKRVAEEHLGCPVSRAVLAYPLAFGEAQRAEIERAARIAGLEIAAILPEPVAAAIAYGRHGHRDEVVGVYDFGGGTFDFCVLRMGRGEIKVLAAAGDPWLGGDDFDQALGRHVANEFWRSTQIEVRRRAAEWQQVLQACEEAKCYLSLVDEIEVAVPDVARTPTGPLDLSVSVTRDTFSKLVTELIETSLSVVQSALDEIDLKVSDIDQLLLTGGTTRVHAVQDAARRFFGREPHYAVHPELAVVIGASVKAAEVAGRSVSEGPWPGLTVQQIAGRSIGMALAGGVTEPIIHRSTALPALVRRVMLTKSDDQTDLEIHIVEGESSLTAENRTVGRVSISGLTPRPAGESEVDVVFHMNDSGTLNITARDLTSGRKTVTVFELDGGGD
jgi:molecular chaperone DnaK